MQYPSATSEKGPGARGTSSTSQRKGTEIEGFTSVARMSADARRSPHRRDRPEPTRWGDVEPAQHRPEKQVSRWWMDRGGQLAVDRLTGEPPVHQPMKNLEVDGAGGRGGPERCGSPEQPPELVAEPHQRRDRHDCDRGPHQQRTVPCPPHSERGCDVSFHRFAIGFNEPLGPRVSRFRWVALMAWAAPPGPRRIG